MAKKYSAKERKAFHMGRAFATAKAGGRIKGMNEEQKASFRNGIKSVKDKKSMQSNYKVFTAYVAGLGNCLVDNDGCILKVLNGGVK